MFPGLTSILRVLRSLQQHRIFLLTCFSGKKNLGSVPLEIYMLVETQRNWKILFPCFFQIIPKIELSFKAKKNIWTLEIITYWAHNIKNSLKSIGIFSLFLEALICWKIQFFCKTGKKWQIQIISFFCQTTSSYLSIPKNFLFWPIFTPEIVFFAHDSDLGKLRTNFKHIWNQKMSMSYTHYPPTVSKKSMKNRKKCLGFGPIFSD